MLKHHTHTFPIFINLDSEILILGSFPSVKSRENMFYYAHPQNRFFKVLSILFNEEYSQDLTKRKDMLIKHKIALYDVIEECDIEGSADNTICNIKVIDINAILKEYPNIKVIATTGSKAASLFKKYLLDKVGDRRIYFLPSTSPANAKMKLEELLEKYKVLLNKQD